MQSALSARSSRCHTGHRQRSRSVRVAAVGPLNNNSETPGPLPPPLSLYTPYKSLPPSGQLIPPHEESCDIEVSNCKDRMYVFETKCEACSGTGYARGSSSRSRGRGRGRASLCMCLVCTGIGHVRRTTARYAPDTQGGDLHHMTLAREQRLPGEPEQRTLQPTVPQKTRRAEFVRRVAEKLAAASKADQGPNAPPPNTVRSPSPEQRQQSASPEQNGSVDRSQSPANNIVSSSRLVGSRPGATSGVASD